MMQKTTPQKNINPFAESMLKSAEENKQAKPQTRFGDVDPKEIENVFKAIQKGKFRQ